MEESRQLRSLIQSFLQTQREEQAIIESAFEDVRNSLAALQSASALAGETIVQNIETIQNAIDEEMENDVCEVFAGMSQPTIKSLMKQPQASRTEDSFSTIEEVLKVGNILDYEGASDQDTSADDAYKVLDGMTISIAAGISENGAYKVFDELTKPMPTGLQSVSSLHKMSAAIFTTAKAGNFFFFEEAGEPQLLTMASLRAVRHLFDEMPDQPSVQPENKKCELNISHLQLVPGLDNEIWLGEISRFVFDPGGSSSFKAGVVHMDKANELCPHKIEAADVAYKVFDETPKSAPTVLQLPEMDAFQVLDNLTKPIQPESDKLTEPTQTEENYGYILGRQAVQNEPQQSHLPKLEIIELWVGEVPMLIFDPCGCHSKNSIGFSEGILSVLELLIEILGPEFRRLNACAIGLLYNAWYSGGIGVFLLENEVPNNNGSKKLLERLAKQCIISTSEGSVSSSNALLHFGDHALVDNFGGIVDSELVIRPIFRVGDHASYYEGISLAGGRNMSVCWGVFVMEIEDCSFIIKVENFIWDPGWCVIFYFIYTSLGSRMFLRGREGGYALVVIKGLNALVVIKGLKI